MREQRGGTVTFVFTDIDGSTRLVREFKERWPDVRSAHRKIVRDAFAAHGGDEVDTQGDSFFYVYGRARDAALAAADAQRGLAAHDWPADGEGARAGRLGRSLPHRPAPDRAHAVPGAAPHHAGWAALDREVAERALVIPLTNGKVVDLVSKRVGNYEQHPVFGLLLDQLWVR